MAEVGQRLSGNGANLLEFDDDLRHLLTHLVSLLAAGRLFDLTAQAGESGEPQCGARTLQGEGA